jgi:hypothetical protein
MLPPCNAGLIRVTQFTFRELVTHFWGSTPCTPAGSFQRASHFLFRPEEVNARSFESSVMIYETSVTVQSPVACRPLLTTVRTSDLHQKEKMSALSNGFERSCLPRTEKLIAVLSNICFCTQSLCGLVVRVSGCKPIGPGYDCRRYQIFRVGVGLERGPLRLVSINVELRSSKPRLTAVGDPLR